MSGFHDDLFPLDIALGAEGGPVRRTDIVTLVSGREERNATRARSRRRYNAGYGIKSLADMDRLIAFFEARHGRLYAFRFRDPFDHQSCAIGKAPSGDDQVIGQGDGSTRTFALVKRYESGGGAYVRAITRPVAGSVIVHVDGAPVDATLDATPEASTDAQGSGNTSEPGRSPGAVTLATPPANGAVITAGFVFDTPVRFDTDDLQLTMSGFEAGLAPSIPLIEVLS